MAERVKCKPPRKERAVVEPVRTVEPQGRDSDLDSNDDQSEPSAVDDLDVDLEPLDLEPLVVEPRRVEPPRVEPRRTEPLRAEPRRIIRPADGDNFKRPKDDGFTKPSPNDDDDAGTILLEPIRPPTPPTEEIKVEPVQPVYVEMKKPLKRKYK
jgi:hypothetical protein